MLLIIKLAVLPYLRPQGICLSEIRLYGIRVALRGASGIITIYSDLILSKVISAPLSAAWSPGLSLLFCYIVFIPIKPLSGMIWLLHHLP